VAAVVTDEALVVTTERTAAKLTANGQDYQILAHHQHHRHDTTPSHLGGGKDRGKHNSKSSAGIGKNW